MNWGDILVAYHHDVYTGKDFLDQLGMTPSVSNLPKFYILNTKGERYKCFYLLTQ